jgi:hypothetical protein
VPIDAGVVEWFIKRTGSGMSMAIDINEVLKSHIRTKERAAARKKR